MDDEAIRKQTAADELETKRWKNRRRMAWVSLAFLIFVGFWVLFSPDIDRIAKISDVLNAIIYSMTTVVGVYMGLATWSQIGK